MAWLFEDECDREADLVLDMLLNSGISALVPTIWGLEVGNVLVQAERRGRISAAQVDCALELLAELPITVDGETDGRAFTGILDFARAETLTTYDAIYLEIAVRHRIPLATRDQALLQAAGRLGIGIFPASPDCP